MLSEPLYSEEKVNAFEQYNSGLQIARENGLLDGITMNGRIFNRKLGFSIACQKEYGQKFASKLKTEFEKSVEEIAEYCNCTQPDLHENSLAVKEYEKLSCLSNGKKSALICFPYASGDDLIFMNLSNEIMKKTDNIAVYALKKYYSQDEFEDALNEIIDLIEKYDDVILYGHCAGNYLLIKTYDRLRNFKKIKKLILGGTALNKPYWILRKLKIYTKDSRSDKEIFDFLNNLGAGFEELPLQEQNDIILQYRKDFDSVTKDMYNYNYNKKITIPGVVVLGEKDPLTPNPPKICKSWNSIFEKNVNMHIIEKGNHFFQSQSADKLAEIVISNFY